MLPDDWLLRIAESIADGRAVDWEAEARAHPDSAHLLKRLRVFQMLAADPNGAQASDGDEPPVTPSEGGAQPTWPSQWGHLSIRAKLGSGSFGEVFLAYDPSLRMDVAVKLLSAGSEADQGRFLAEAQRLAKVRHPNVVPVHGAAVHDGRVGFWTDVIHGVNLDEHVERVGILGPREAALVGIEICRGLAALHAAGIVHRDVKPSNVRREDGGRIVVMDLGAGGDVPAPDVADLESRVQGTPRYMAPERLRGEVAGPASDIYSLGVLLYWAVSGAYPVDASTFHEQAGRHERGAIVPLLDRRPELPPAFIRVVDRALDPDPRRRFSSAGAMERALAGVLESAGTAHRTARIAVVIVVTSIVALFSALALTRPRNAPHAVALATPIVSGSTVAGWQDGKAVWNHPHGEPVEFLAETPWRHDWVYGMASGADDGGSAYVVDGPTGLGRWTVAPKLAEVKAVFGEEYAQPGAFECDRAYFAQIDGKGTPEMILLWRHGSYYPAILGIYREDGTRLGAYFHFGMLHRFVFGDFDGDGKQEILVAGTNNGKAYQGATVFLLDAAHCFGAGADSLNHPACPLRDCAIRRVILPWFGPEFMKPGERLEVEDLRTYRTPDGALRVVIVLHQWALLVTLDQDLRPISADPSDETLQYTATWPKAKRERFLSEGFLNSWLGRYYLYVGGTSSHVPVPLGASPRP